MHYVYILKSGKDNRYYIGKTNNISRRITEHYLGKTHSLRYRMPLYLIHVEDFQTNIAVVRREHYLKSLKCGNAFQNIVEHASLAPLLHNTTRE